MKRSHEDRQRDVCLSDGLTGRQFYIHVALPSGQSRTLGLLSSEPVKALRKCAQDAFETSGRLKLLTAEGQPLAESKSLEVAGLKDGDHLTGMVLEAKIASTSRAFAFFYAGGDKILSWGDEEILSSSHLVKVVKSVQHVQATQGGFAAILSDDSVTTWGHHLSGGDSTGLFFQAASIQATEWSFAAIQKDGGKVVTWGNPRFCRYALEVQDQLHSVGQIQSTNTAFAAIRYDGSVVTWGDERHGADSSRVKNQLLSDVERIQATHHAFAAIKADGSVVTWGNPESGGDSSAVQDQLTKVQHIQATFRAFAAILADGSVVAWGHPSFGGDNSRVKEQLRNVQHVQAASNGAFAAILTDGSAVAWGHAAFGGDSSGVQSQLKDVRHIQATGCAFAAILADESVVTWGNPSAGGDSSQVHEQLRNVQQIQATNSAFAAILTDGSVVTWGSPEAGGDSSAVQDRLKNVRQIQATESAFAALLANGLLVVWGEAYAGGHVDWEAWEAALSWEVKSGCGAHVHPFSSWNCSDFFSKRISSAVVLSRQDFWLAFEAVPSSAEIFWRLPSFDDLPSSQTGTWLDVARISYYIMLVCSWM